jgi:hypothetical protein
MKIQDVLNFVNEEMGGEVKINQPIDERRLAVSVVATMAKNNSKVKPLDNIEMKKVANEFVEKFRNLGLEGVVPEDIIIGINQNDVTFSCKGQNRSGAIITKNITVERQEQQPEEPTEPTYHNNAQNDTFQRYGNIRNKVGQ